MIRQKNSAGGVLNGALALEGLLGSNGVVRLWWAGEEGQLEAIPLPCRYVGPVLCLLIFQEKLGI